MAGYGLKNLDARKRPHFYGAATYARTPLCSASGNHPAHFGAID
jgi:hypothetical protein